MTSSLGDLTIGLATDLSKLTPGISEAKGQISGIADTSDKTSTSFLGHIGNMTSGIIHFAEHAGLAIGGVRSVFSTLEGIGQTLFGGDAAMEQTQTAFTQLLHSSTAATAELKDLQSFAAATPFEFPELADSTQKLLAFQIPLKDTKPLLTAVGDALSGLGKNSAADLDQVVNVFGQMNAAGKIQTQDLMQLTSVGINGFQLLADQMHKPVATIKEMVTAGVIPAKDGIEMLRKGMEATFGGGMQAQSQTFNGLLSTFDDNIKSAWRSFTGPLFEQAKGGLVEMGNLVSSSAFQDFAKTLGEGVGHAFTALGGAIQWVGNILKSVDLSDFKEAWKAVSMEVGQLGYEFGQLGAKLKPVGDDLGPILTPIADGIQAIAKAGLGTVTNLLWGFSQAFVSLDKAGGGNAFKGLASGLKEAEAPLSKVSDIIGGVFEHRMKVIGPLVQELGGWFHKDLIPAFQEALPGFEHLGNAILTKLVPALAHIWADGQKIIDAFLPPLVHGFEAVAPPLIKVAGFLADNLAKGLEFIAPYLVQAADTVTTFAEGLATKLEPAAKNVWAVLSVGLDYLHSMWDAVWPGLSLTLKGVWDMIRGIVEIGWSLISGIINVGLDILGGNWSGAWTDMQKSVDGIWQGIKDLTGGALEAIGGLIWAAGSAILSNLTWPFKEGWKIIQGIFGDIGKGVHDLVSSTPLGGVLHFAAVPGFAEGVQSYSGGLAVVGERGPELAYLPSGTSIAPNSSLNALLAGSGSPIIVEVHNYNNIDGKRMTDVIMTHAMKEIRRNGVRAA